MIANKERPTQTIVVNDHQFCIENQAAEVYGGAVHYWRLERDKWDDILNKVKDMGFTTISIYIPWEVHEIERGRFDFGEINPSNDIDAFLTMIEEKGMNIVVRPGPQINSELTWFGYPGRILNDPDLQALNAQGTKAVLTQVPRPIPALSYAEDKFFEETTLWYDAICPILVKHVYPNGRLVAAQVDNEMAFFFHVNAYACDFHPASIRNYQSFLQDKYGSIEQLSEVYGQNYQSFDEIDAPRRFAATRKEEIPWYVDWIEYREMYLINCIDRLAKMMRARGLQDIALFHNYPHPLGPGGAVSGFTTPFHLMGLEEVVDFVGFDIYSRKELYDHVKTVVSYVVGTSRYPYIPEFIAGVWPWYLNPGELYDEEFVTKAALMHGIKGFSRYMLVERDRWLDSPIRRDGRVREDHAAMFGQVNKIMTQHKFVDLRRQSDVLLMANREYDRLEAASVLISFPGDFLETPTGFSEYPTFMTTSEQPLGFEEPIQLAKVNWFTRCYKGLTEAGYGFLLSDTALAPNRWQQFKAIVVGSFEYMNTALQQNLLEFARSGGIVILGPQIPHLNEHMQSDNTLASALQNGEAQANSETVYMVGEGRIVHLRDLSNANQAFTTALEGLDLIRFSRNDTRLDVAIHRASNDSGHDSGQLIVFVANPTGEQINAEINLGVELKSVREIWEDRDVQTNGQTLNESLSAYTIQIYECAL
ncbi:beta-galactosidase [filamentous cyanobacterium CCP1]|nr:beta-galactosidase [filamentous cyanobacterium CCP2]PSB68465.1 beta-galactosidase [filamentous cyanobacterium CCP1]